MPTLSVCVGVRLASTDHVCSRRSGSMLGYFCVFPQDPSLHPVLRRKTLFLTKSVQNNRGEDDFSVYKNFPGLL